MSSPVSTIVSRLHRDLPNATYELDWTTPEELLVATILAARCTDVRVNQVTATLFKTYPSPRAFAEADLGELEEALRPTGAYKQKAKRVKDTMRLLVERHGGKVPPEMAKLTALPGVARKTANVVLNVAFKQPSGIIVDTHVHRVSRRMGLAQTDKPDAIEQELMRQVPKAEWPFFGPAMVLHGRYTCTSKAPRCAGCRFEDLCPRLHLDEGSEEE